VQVLQIAVVEEPANHVRRDVFRALLVKQVAGHELKIAIGASQPSLETSLQKTPDSTTTAPAARPSEWRYVNQKRGTHSV
jgi:hypothetical protein